MIVGGRGADLSAIVAIELISTAGSMFHHHAISAFKPSFRQTSGGKSRNTGRWMLQVDCIDLVQLHWWDYRVPGLIDTLRWLSDLQAEGLIRSLGVTNLDTVHVEQITDAGIQLVSNQVWFYPLSRYKMLQMCGMLVP